MLLECHACGKRFRSAIKEAHHRHNFPVLCARNKRFKAFIAETTKDEPPVGLPTGRLKTNEPVIQNIPIRTPEGAAIRAALLSSRS